MLTHETPIAIHVAGKSEPIREADGWGTGYRQTCTRCGKLLNTEIMGYLTGAKIAEDTHFIAMYIGDLAPNCVPVQSPLAQHVFDTAVALNRVMAEVVKR